MSPSEISQRLTAEFGEKILASHAEDKHPRVHLDAADWPAVAAFLKQDSALAFDWLACLTGMDYAADGKIAVVYDFLSTTYGHRFAVKVFTGRDNPAVPSVASRWPAANWHEREAWDLFGIAFPGHPDPRRILMADDWDGHPLRKDYVFPRQVHGIPGSVELDWQQKP